MPKRRSFEPEDLIGRILPEVMANAVKHSVDKRPDTTRRYLYRCLDSIIDAGTIARDGYKLENDSEEEIRFFQSASESICANAMLDKHNSDFWLCPEDYEIFRCALLMYANSVLRKHSRAREYYEKMQAAIIKRNKRGGATG